MKTLYNLLTIVKAESSTNKKQEILKTFFNNIGLEEDELFLRLLKMYIDPQWVSYFDKAMIKKAENIKPSKLFSNGYPSYNFITLLNTLHSRLLSGNRALEEYGKFIDNCDEKTRYVLDTILLKKPHGITVKSVNKAYKAIFGEDLVKVFECQLANKYEEDKNYKTLMWYISPKLDGLRCLYREGKLFTRQNKPIIGFDHLEEELEALVKKYDLDLIDGELYSHEIPFHDIQGIVTRNKNINEENKRKIKFNIFACTGNKIKNTHEMMDVLYTIDRNLDTDNIEIVEQCYIKNDPSAIRKKTEEYIKWGYEGAMLRHPEIHYENKRSNSLLKVKFFNEMDMVITDIFEGDGKYEGLLGGFHVKSLDGKITAKVGSGFTDEQRKEFYDSEMEYAQNITNELNKNINILDDSEYMCYLNDMLEESGIETLIGKKVEIKYFEITPDNSLRFPVFLKLKEDR